MSTPNRMSGPLLIAVTGPDGSGKSTACSLAGQKLTQRLGKDQVTEVSVWDCLAEQVGVHGVTRPAFRSPQEAAQYLGDLDGTSRTLFIFHAMARALQLAMRKQTQVILLNGYWYKYAVSEIGYGVDPDFVLGASVGFAVPAHVFSLDIDPATAWERRQKATDYEQGGVSAEGTERERFLGFQTKIRRVWTGVEAQTGLHWEHMSALASADDIAGEIASGVMLRLGKEQL